MNPDPLTVPEDPYATVDEGNPGAVILWAGAAWIVGFVLLALIVVWLVRR